MNRIRLALIVLITCMGIHKGSAQFILIKGTINDCTKCNFIYDQLNDLDIPKFYLFNSGQQKHAKIIYEKLEVSKEQVIFSDKYVNMFSSTSQAVAYFDLYGKKKLEASIDRVTPFFIDSIVSLYKLTDFPLGKTETPHLFRDKLVKKDIVLNILDMGDRSLYYSHEVNNAIDSLLGGLTGIRTHDSLHKASPHIPVSSKSYLFSFYKDKIAGFSHKKIKFLKDDQISLVNISVITFFDKDLNIINSYAKDINLADSMAIISFHFGLIDDSTVILLTKNLKNNQKQFAQYRLKNHSIILHQLYQFNTTDALPDQSLFDHFMFNTFHYPYYIGSNSDILFDFEKELSYRLDLPFDPHTERLPDKFDKDKKQPVIHIYSQLLDKQFILITKIDSLCYWIDYHIDDKGGFKMARYTLLNQYIPGQFATYVNFVPDLKNRLLYYTRNGKLRSIPMDNFIP